MKRRPNPVKAKTHHRKNNNTKKILASKDKERRNLDLKKKKVAKGTEIYSYTSARRTANAEERNRELQFSPSQSLERERISSMK